MNFQVVATQICLEFSPRTLGKMIPILTHIFQLLFRQAVARRNLAQWGTFPDSFGGWVLKMNHIR